MDSPSEILLVTALQIETGNVASSCFKSNESCLVLVLSLYQDQCYVFLCVISLNSQQALG